MKCSPKRRSALALAISGLVLTSAAGCGDGDQRAADKNIRETVSKAFDARRIPTTQSVQTAIADLSKAANTDANAASNVGKIEARSNLAQAELEAARREVRTLAGIEPQVSQALWEVARIAARIERLNTAQAAGAKASPDAILKGIADRRQQMVAAGEAASKRIAELQGQIDKIKGEVANLTQQKDAAAAEADALADRASKATGKEASDLADQANESRRKAGHLGHDIDRTSAALLPLERDLAAEQTKKKTADEAVVALDANRADVESAWQAAQAKAAEQKTAAGQLGQELTDRGRQLEELSKQATEVRSRAADMFAKSAQHSGAAAKDATALATELGKWSQNFAQSPEKKAWDQLKATYSMGTFRLAEAEAEHSLGNLHNEHALQLQERQQVAAQIAKTLQDAGITMPPVLAAAQAEHKAAAEAANAAYTSAAQKFIDVYQGSAPKELQNSAHISRMFSLYGQYLGGDKSKLAEAKAEVAEAFAERTDDPLVRSLPAELRAAVPTAPAGGGATPPAGATPADPATPGAAATPNPAG